MRSVVAHLAPHLLALAPEPENKELKNAEKGLPSSSKPGKASVKSAGVPALVPQAANTFPESPSSEIEAERPVLVLPKTKAKEAPAEPSPKLEPLPKAEPKAKLEAKAKVEAINSATHRAAHARLVRKMEKLDVAIFPQVAKLWSGSRKDSGAEQSLVFFLFRFFTSTKLPLADLELLGQTRSLEAVHRQ